MPSTMFRRMSLFADDPLPRVTGAAFQGDRVPWAKATRSSYRASRNRLTWWEAAFFKGPNNESDGAAARATLCYYGYSPPRRPGWLRSSRTHWGPCTNCPRSGASVTSLPFPFRSLTHRGGGAWKDGEAAGPLMKTPPHPAYHVSTCIHLPKTPLLRGRGWHIRGTPAYWKGGWS